MGRFGICRLEHADQLAELRLVKVDDPQPGRRERPAGAFQLRAIARGRLAAPGVTAMRPSAMRTAIRAVAKSPRLELFAVARRRNGAATGVGSAGRKASGVRFFPRNEQRVSPPAFLTTGYAPAFIGLAWLCTVMLNARARSAAASGGQGIERSRRASAMGSSAIGANAIGLHDVEVAEYFIRHRLGRSQRKT